MVERDCGISTARIGAFVERGNHFEAIEQSARREDHGAVLPSFDVRPMTATPPVPGHHCLQSKLIPSGDPPAFAPSPVAIAPQPEIGVKPAGNKGKIVGFPAG
jgi:hypothetical protein